MSSSKFMNRILLNLNNKKDNKDDFKTKIVQNKRKSLEFQNTHFLNLQNIRYKKKSVEIPRQRLKKNSLESINIKNKKNSLEFFNPRNSKLSNKISQFELTRKKSILSYNGFTYNNNGNSSFSGSEIDYKVIGEEIKYNLLEMKNNLMDLNDGLDIYKENSCNGEFDEGLTSYEILKDLKNDNDSSKNSKKIKIRKSLTNRVPFNLNKKGNNLNIKKFNCVKNNIANHKSCKILRKRFKKSEKFDLKKTDIKALLAEKNRIYRKGGQIEDSYNESESDEEIESDNFLINPETTTFFIYDSIIAILAIYSLIFIPFEMADDCFCDEGKNKYKNYIKFIIDILFIIDVIINFFLEFYTTTEKLVKSRSKIINNYLSGWFFFDLLNAVPMNIIYHYYCQSYPFQICHTYEKRDPAYLLVLLKCLKALKIFKMPVTKKNQLISLLTELASNNTTETVDLIIELLLVIFGLHILSCIHIFIGKYTYPGWIFANEFKDNSKFNLYMISIYYLITTMTTVGYGDISSDSFVEIIFRIILLAVGIVCYSWIISSISNGINKQSYASLNYSNECNVLENIRRENAELTFELYNEIMKHLEYKNFHQQIYDKNLLIDSLPYSLKNNLIFSMYKMEIQKFAFFKGISNTNFLSKILYNFSPKICKKNEILLKENEIIDEIYFVREGRLTLEIAINMNMPEESANEYLSQEFNNFAFNFEEEDAFNNLPNIIDENISEHSISSIFEEKHKNVLFSVLGDKDFNLNKKDPTIIYLKISDVYKNETYGELYMYHGKRSPFSVKVKTKSVKLYIIKKDDYSNLCDSYKNVIQRIQKKEKKNIKKIKNILINTIDRFCNSNGIRIKDEYIPSIEKAKKELNKNMLPNIFKNNNISKSILNDEIDEKINKTIIEFNNEFKKVSTKLKMKNKYELKKEIITKERNKMKNVNGDVNANVNINKKRVKPMYRSLNILQKGSIGSNIVRSFSPNNKNELSLPKNSHYLTSKELSNLIYKKIKDEKKKLNEKLKISESNNKIEINNEIKINEIKPVVKAKEESDKTLKNFNSNHTDNEKESNKTVKLELNDNESGDKEPLTINNLSEELQKIIRSRFENDQMLKNNENKLKIEHIHIEINNYKNNINYIYNNSFLDNSKINTSNNLSNFNINSSKSENIAFNGEINQNINEYEKNNNKKYKKSSSYNLKNKEKKKKKDNSHEALKLNKRKYRKKALSLLFKNNENKSKIKKEGTEQNSTGLSLSPINSSKFLSKLNTSKLISPNYKYQKSSVNNKNILLKLNEEIDTNNNFSSENLTATSADSFHIKRSYKNLNQASGGKYIKNKKLQNKTIKFIKEFDINRKKEWDLKSRFTGTFDIHNLMKGNKEEEENKFKKIEKTIKSVKTKMNDILLNKKKKSKIYLNIPDKDENNDSMIAHSPSPKKRRSKLTKNKLSLNSDSENYNNSSLQMISLSINPDDTLTKLNCSNNEMIRMNIKKDNLMRSENVINYNNYNSFFSDKKK